MAGRVEEVWEKSVVESRTHRGYERRWVEPGGKVVIGGRRTRLFTQDEWESLFPPSGPEWSRDEDDEPEWSCDDDREWSR